MRTRIVFACEQAFTWLTGSVLIPLLLIVFVVVAKEVSFAHAVERGELFALGGGVAGASLALELILQRGRLASSAYRMALLLLLLANVVFFAGTVETSGGAVTTALNDTQRSWSMVFLIFSAMFGAATVARQAWQMFERQAL